MRRRYEHLAAEKTRIPTEKFLFVSEILMMDIKLQNARSIETPLRWFAVSLQVSRSQCLIKVTRSQTRGSSIPNHRWPRSGYSWWRSASPAPRASSFSYSAMIIESSYNIITLTDVGKSWFIVNVITSSRVAWVQIEVVRRRVLIIQFSRQLPYAIRDRPAWLSPVAVCSG